MCIGIPMQVVERDADGDFAECVVETADVMRERLDMRLIGAQAEGTWVLAFNSAARRVLDADEAARIRDALAALRGALDGSLDAGSGAFDALFADLVDREPALPEHLRPVAAPPV
jgi:hydrogenase expression/formation protein HypC